MLCHFDVVDQEEAYCAECSHVTRSAFSSAGFILLVSIIPGIVAQVVRLHTSGEGKCVDGGRATDHLRSVSHASSVGTTAQKVTGTKRKPRPRGLETFPS